MLKPEHEMLAISSSANQASDSKQLLNCRRFNTTYYCENLFVVKHRSEHMHVSAVDRNETASVINEKCKVEYCCELQPEPSILDAGNYLLLAWLSVPFNTFLYKRQIPNPKGSSLYVIIKWTQWCLFSISTGPDYLQEIFFSVRMIMWMFICIILEI